MVKVLRLTCATALLAGLIAAPAAAQTPVDRRTIFTFSGPVTMPGVTLPAGEYVFRLANPNSSADVVQVLSSDGTKPYGLFFSRPVDRLEPPADPEVRFMETAAGMPAAIRSWWYPGQSKGYEFVYPKEQARRLAQAASQPVLTTMAQSTTAEETNTSELARISSSGQETRVDADAGQTSADLGGINQQGQVASSSVLIEDATVPPPPARSSADPRPVATSGQAERTRTTLPQTASALPVFAWLGTLASVGGLGLWAWRRRYA